MTRIAAVWKSNYFLFIYLCIYIKLVIYSFFFSYHLYFLNSQIYVSVQFSLPAFALVTFCLLYFLLNDELYLFIIFIISFILHAYSTNTPYTAIGVLYFLQPVLSCACPCSIYFFSLSLVLHAPVLFISSAVHLFYFPKNLRLQNVTNGFTHLKTWRDSLHKIIYVIFFIYFKRITQTSLETVFKKCIISLQHHETKSCRMSQILWD